MTSSSNFCNSLSDSLIFLDKFLIMKKIKKDKTKEEPKHNKTA